VGYSQSQQNTLLEDRVLAFSPKGTTALLSFDLTPDWSLSVDYTKLNDKQIAANNSSGELEVSSWGVGLSRYVNDWTFSLSYSDWHDNLLVQLRDKARFLDETTRSPATSFSGAYDWDHGSWQLGLSAGVHFSGWQKVSITPVANNTHTQAIDEGNSTFVSFALSTAKLIEIKQLASGLSALRTELQTLGLWQQVTVAIYSEFGRLVAANASNGTDHGTAASHLIMGAALKAECMVNPLP
jgi:hypothetical protein